MNRLPTELKLMRLSTATSSRNLKSFLFRTAYWVCNAPSGWLSEAHYKFCCHCYCFMLPGFYSGWRHSHPTPNHAVYTWQWLRLLAGVRSLRTDGGASTVKIGFSLCCNYSPRQQPSTINPTALGHNAWARWPFIVVAVYNSCSARGDIGIGGVSVRPSVRHTLAGIDSKLMTIESCCFHRTIT